MTALRTSANCLAALALIGAGWLFATTDGRDVLRIVRYEWIGGRQLIGGVPRREIPCPSGNNSRRMVAVLFGQSNAANSVRGRHTPHVGVVNYFAGRCYVGDDPLPGATGTGGSVWSRLGDLLLESGRYDEVVFAGLAVDASEIARWAPGGDLNPGALAVLRGLHGRNLEPTHLLWHQGERDMQLKTTAEDYRDRFARVLTSIRETGTDAPIYVALASWCRGRLSSEIRTAQAALVAPASGVRAGPDTDALRGPDLRHDDCHFSAAGAARHAALWRDALIAAIP